MLVLGRPRSMDPSKVEEYGIFLMETDKFRHGWSKIFHIFRIGGLFLLSNDQFQNFLCKIFKSFTNNALFTIKPPSYGLRRFHWYCSEVKILVGFLKQIMASCSYKLRPLKLGAEVFGIDLKAPIDKATIEEIKRDVTKHRLLVFRDQGVVPGNRQVEIAKWFGDVDSIPFYKHPKSPSK